MDRIKKCEQSQQLKQKQDEFDKQSLLKDLEQSIKQQQNKMSKLFVDFKQQNESKFKELENQFQSQNLAQMSEINALHRQIEQLEFQQQNELQTLEKNQNKQGQNSLKTQDLSNSLERSLLQTSVGVRTRAWEKDIESRMFKIESQIQEKLEVEDLEQFQKLITNINNKQSEKVQELTQHAYNSELTCNHLKENAEQNIQKFNTKISEVQNSIRNIEQTLNGFTQNNPISSQVISGSELNLFQELERKLSIKIAQSVEKLGNLMKKQAGIQKGLNDKIMSLEKEFNSFNSRSISPIQGNSISLAKAQQESPKKINKEEESQQSLQKLKKQLQVNEQSEQRMQKLQKIEQQYSNQQNPIIYNNENSGMLTLSLDKSLKDFENILPKMPESHSPSFRSPYEKVQTQGDEVEQKIQKQKKKKQNKARSKTPENQKAIKLAESSRSSLRTPKHNKVISPPYHTTKSFAIQQRNKKKMIELEKTELQDKRQQEQKSAKKKKVKIGNFQTKNKKESDAEDNNEDRRVRLEAIYKDLTYK